MHGVGGSRGQCRWGMAVGEGKRPNGMMRLSGCERGAEAGRGVSQYACVRVAGGGEGTTRALGPASGKAVVPRVRWPGDTCIRMHEQQTQKNVWGWRRRGGDGVPIYLLAERKSVGPG